MGLFSSIAGIFGATQEKRAAGEAVRIINEARAAGTARSNELNAEFTPFVTASRAALEDAGATSGLLQNIIAQTQDLDVGEGLSGADRIAYEDAAKLLNEQMVSTGNLRSGASAFGQAQLLRRVVADANQRRFDRQVTKLGLLFGGQNQLTTQALSRASTAGQIGLYGKQLSADLLKTAMSLAPYAANAEMAKGKALSKGLGFGGLFGEELFSNIKSAVSSFGTTTTTDVPVGEGTAYPSGR